MNSRPGITTVGAVLIAALFIGMTAGAVQAQMCATGSQAGQPSQSSGQSPMMEHGMMKQGMCPMCAMQTMAAQPSSQMEPMGMMGMMNMAEEGQMDAKTRGQLLQMRGEMLKAMGDVMMRHGQALGKTQ
jgi:hypothetical protein